MTAQQAAEQFRKSAPGSPEREAVVEWVWSENDKSALRAGWDITRAATVALALWSYRNPQTGKRVAKEFLEAVR